MIQPVSGSAPHMRGIPGTTCRSRAQSKDQPRTCGEYFAALTAAEHTSGSAPHMRGILISGLSPLMGSGISPAHAGNTGDGAMGGLRSTDQPRTCGEYGSHPIGVAHRIGSAPHMRGILHPEPSGCWRRWISPAHAGNTMRRPGREGYKEDQPRTCGEYLAFP